MRKYCLFTLIGGLLILSSCSKDIHVNYQTESANTGKVVLKPSRPTTSTYVTIDDNLIVDKKKVKSVTINNVPDGDYNIRYTSDNSWYKNKMDVHIRVEMENGKEMTKLVEVPPYSTGYWVYMSGMIVFSASLSLVTLAL